MDSLAADTVPGPPDTPAPAAADSVELSPDSVAADTTGPNLDSLRIAELLTQRPTVYRQVIIVLTEAMIPDTRYVVEATVRSLQNIANTTERLLIIPPAPPPPDSS